jgi:hypothetical protein
MERKSFFLQELGNNSPGFLELESQKIGTQKGMRNLEVFLTGIHGGGHQKNAIATQTSNRQNLNFLIQIQNNFL